MFYSYAVILVGVVNSAYFALNSFTQNMTVLKKDWSEFVCLHITLWHDSNRMMTAAVSLQSLTCHYMYLTSLTSSLRHLSPTELV